MKKIRKLEKISIDKVLPYVKNGHNSSKEKERININGDFVKITSKRLFAFKQLGTKCNCCGLEGKYFIKEKTPNDISYHLSLYGIKPNGKEELLTHDHTIPLSRGGKDDISNFQILCEECNMIKDNSIININELKKLRNIL